MGQPTIPDDFCENCYYCHEADLTPCRKYISFTGIKDCNPDLPFIPPPINDVIRVDQLNGYPCEWYRLFDDDHEFLYNSALLAGSEVKYRWFGMFFFSGWKPENCQVRFSNAFTCAGGHLGEGGEAAIMWNGGPGDNSIGSLLDSINMEPHEKTKFEFWPASEDRICVRFARKSDATNILILVEPTEL